MQIGRAAAIPPLILVLILTASSRIHAGEAAWVSIGPAPLQENDTNPTSTFTNSGRITGIAAHPTDPNTLYIAAAGGGVWKTTNAGTKWTPLTDNQATLFMGAIALAPSNPSVIYAGTGEANNSGDTYEGKGILKSTDGGGTWSLLTNGGTFNRLTVSKIAVSPTDPNTVFVAIGAQGVDGLPGNTGIYRSTDGGTNWTNVTAAAPNNLNSTDAYSDVVIDPSTSGATTTVYCAIGQPFGDNANGVYKSTDNGTTWSQLANFPNGATNPVSRIALAICNSTPQTLYAAISSANDQTIFEMLKTTDGGANWTVLNNAPNVSPPEGGPGSPGQGDYDLVVAVSPTDPNTAFMAGSFGTDSVVLTTDGGNTFSDISHTTQDNGPHADHHAMAFDANGKLLDGNDGGIWRYDTGADTWTDLNGNLATIQFYSVALHPTDPNFVFGGSQDNGVSVYMGNLVWSEFQGTGDGGFTRINQSNPNIIYREFPFGSDFLERSNDGGTTFRDISLVNGIDPSGNDNSNFFAPYAIDPANNSRLLLGTDHVYETTDGGNSWNELGTTGLTAQAPGFFPVDSLGFGPASTKTIYISAGGEIYATTNEGVSWTKKTNPTPSASMPNNVFLVFNCIFVDPGDAAAKTAYVVAANYSADTLGGRVFQTTNGGTSWNDLTGDLPDMPVFCVTLLPGNIIVVGTAEGVFKSLNGGTNWTPLGTGLPNVAAFELTQNTSTLAVATHGRSAWEFPRETLQITGNSSMVAGTGNNLTISVVDGLGNPVTSYTGDKTLVFSGATASTNPVSNPVVTDKSGSPIVFGSNTTITFTNGVANVNGASNGQMTLFNAGSFNITVTDGSLTSQPLTVTVTPGTLKQLTFSLTSPQTNTVAFTGANTLSAADAFGNAVANFDASANNVTLTPQSPLTGTITGLGSAKNNILNQATDFTNGVADLTAHGLIYTGNAGAGTFTATAASGLSASSSITIVGGPPAHFLVENAGGGAIPAEIAFSPFNIQLTAQDASNNVSASFTGTVNITSTGNLDSGGGTTAAFSAGVLNTTVDISNTGNFTLSATQTGATAIGTSNSFAVSLNAPPAISSLPTPSSSPAQVGIPVSFTVGVSDTQPVTITWDFGDGTTAATSSTSGTAVTHTYLIPGNETVTVTLTDQAGQTTTSSFPLVVITPVVTEKTPCDGLNPASMRVQSVTAHMRFPSIGKDTLNLRGSIQLPQGFAVSTATLFYDLGNVTATATLDGKGNAITSNGNGNGKLNLRVVTSRRTGITTGTLRISLKNQSLQNVLQLTNITNLNFTTPKGNTHTSTEVCIIINGTLAFHPNLADMVGVYRAKLNKSGSFSGKNP